MTDAERAIEHNGACWDGGMLALDSKSQAKVEEAEVAVALRLRRRIDDKHATEPNLLPRLTGR